MPLSKAAGALNDGKLRREASTSSMSTPASVISNRLAACRFRAVAGNHRVQHRAYGIAPADDGLAEQLRVMPWTFFSIGLQARTNAVTSGSGPTWRLQWP